MAKNLRLHNILDAPSPNKNGPAVSIAKLKNPTPKGDLNDRPLPLEPSEVDKGQSSNDLLKRQQPRNGHGPSDIGRVPLKKQEKVDEPANVELAPLKPKEERDHVPQTASTSAKPVQAAGSKSAVPLAGVLNRSSTPDADQQQAHGQQEREQKDSASRKRARLDTDSSDFVHLPKPPPQKSKKPPAPRIPPLLQGLHEPPPNAALFPPITTSGSLVTLSNIPSRSTTTTLPLAPAKSTAEVKEKAAVDESPTDAKASASPESPTIKRDVAPRKKWTNEETRHLLKGVAMFGIGSWKKILSHPDFKFNGRTAVDLRDRFRVCRPEDYVHPKESSKKKDASEKATGASKSEGGMSVSTLLVDSDSLPESEVKPKEQKRKSSRSHHKDDAELASLGINAPFSKSTRRDRRMFSKEEDVGLLQGFEKYGACWSEIRKDPDMGLSERTPRDLRDRFRNKFPDKYSQDGRKLPPEKSSKTHTKDTAAVSKPETSSDTTSPAKKDRSSSSSLVLPVSSSTFATFPTQTRAQSPPLHLLPQFLPDLFPSDDPFAHGDDDENASDSQGHVVLDRSIFDWVNQNHGTLTTTAPEVMDMGRSSTSGSGYPRTLQGLSRLPPAVDTNHNFIDPLVTLKPASGLL